MQVKHRFKGKIRRGVACLSFSLDGKRLAIVGVDNKHSIAIYDLQTETCITHSVGDTSIIAAIEFKKDNEFVTVGPKHFKHWTFNNKHIKARKGLFGSGKDKGRNKVDNMLTCVTFSSNDAICGSMKG